MRFGTLSRLQPRMDESEVGEEIPSLPQRAQDDGGVNSAARNAANQLLPGCNQVWGAAASSFRGGAAASRFRSLSRTSRKP